MNELRLTKDDVLTALEIFKKSTGIQLPEGYIEMLKTMETPSVKMMDKDIKNMTPKNDK